MPDSTVLFVNEGTLWEARSNREEEMVGRLVKEENRYSRVVRLFA
jgi:hypothetical protein